MRGESFPLTRNVNARRDDGTFPILSSGLRLLLYDDASPIRIHQAQFRIQKRFADRLGFLVGYTLGSAKSIADNGTPSNHYDLMADWGPTSNDVRHRFVSNVIYELPWGFQVGTIVTANSAPPYNITLGTDANQAATTTTVGITPAARRSQTTSARRDPSGRVSGEVRKVFNVFSTLNLNNFNGNQSSAAGRRRPAPTGFAGTAGLRSVPGPARLQATLRVAGRGAPRSIPHSPRGRARHGGVRPLVRMGRAARECRRACRYLSRDATPGECLARRPSDEGRRP
jgi:hypothetical protein